jgi:hypothetical protein
MAADYICAGWADSRDIIYITILMIQIYGIFLVFEISLNRSFGIHFVITLTQAELVRQHHNVLDLKLLSIRLLVM